MNVNKGNAAEEQQAPPHSRGLIFLLLSIVPFSQIPMDAYTPALPIMVRDLHTTNAAVQNTVTLYILGMSLALIPIGMVADAIGRKKTLLFCLLLFIATSFGCAAANHIGLLIVLRFIQGIGGSACMVITYAIAADLFRGRELTSIAGLLGMAWGLAPVLAPAAGGFIVQYTSWRMVFVLIAMMMGIVAFCVWVFLPETLPAEKRTPIEVGKAAQVLLGAIRSVQFRNFTIIFGLMGSAQLVFGVVAPFLYQVNLGFSAAAYGLIALGLGVANFLGELACSVFATRTTPRKLCFGGWLVYAIGAVVLALFGTFLGSNFWAITIGGAITLAGCATLCPTMYGMSLGLFSKNLGLIGGFISAVCYLIISISMAIVAYLPESSPAPMGWLYVGIAILSFALLALSLSSDNKQTTAVSV